MQPSSKIQITDQVGDYAIPVATCSKITDYHYSQKATVKDLKQKIFEIEGLAVDLQVLEIKYNFSRNWQVLNITDKTEELLKGLCLQALKIEVTKKKIQ